MTAAPIVRLRHLADIRASNVDKKSVDEHVPVRLCNYVDVYRNDAITDDPQYMRATATPAQVEAFTLRSGDVIVTKDSERPDDIGVPAFVPDDLPGVICGYHLSVLRPLAERLDPKFLYWSLRTRPVQDYFTISAQGVTRFALGYGDLGNTPIPLPPLEEQRAIVRFLDVETAKTDALIEKNAGMSRTLIGLRDSQSVVIPKASMVPLRRAILEICDGPFGSNMKTEHYASEGVRVIRLQNIGAGQFLDEDRSYVARDHFEVFRRHEALARDLLVAGLGDENNRLGRSCLVPDDIGPAMVKADCFRLRLDQERILHEYAMHYLNSRLAEPEIVWQARGATRLRMNARGISALLIPMPSMAEQLAYIGRMEELDQQIRALRTKARQEAQLVSEYRSALVTAAVTGQIDVGIAA